MKKAFLLSLTSILLISCNAPEMNKGLLEKMLFGQEEGLIVGAYPSETWEKIKTNIHSNWKVEEEDKCNGINLAITSEKGNHLTLVQLEKSLKLHLYTTFPIDENGSWIITDQRR